MIPQKTAERPPESSIQDDEAAPRAWLKQWPAAPRSLISNMFHFAVRAGATTPILVVSTVQAELRRRLRYARPPLDATDEVLHAVLKSLQITPDEAYPYAQTVLDWEALPRDVRTHQKTARAKQSRDEYMSGLPATEPQRRLLHVLGHTGEVPANRLDASVLIDRLLSTRQGGRP